MYSPPAFKARDLKACLSLISRYAFATVIALPSMEVSHLPLILENDGDKSYLRGHIAKANPLNNLLAKNCELLCIFNGPHGYISPSYYQSEVLNVPTWNYAVVHVKGQGALVSTDKLIKILDISIEKFEFLKDEPWAIDWNNDLTYKKLSGIVGFEIEVSSIEGKFKLSQNRTPIERINVIKGLTASNDTDDQQLALFMQQE